MGSPGKRLDFERIECPNCGEKSVENSGKLSAQMEIQRCPTGFARQPETEKWKH
jgi:predicted RNA-binding Zn-ribbon protein involved in translation (DUF1610 family)